MDLHLNGKLAVVTGAAQGIGEAISEGFADEGCNLLLIDKSDLVNKVAERYGGTALVCDLSENGSPVKISKLSQELGGADVLVNNAGVSLPAPLNKMDDKNWDTVLDVNLRVAFRLSRAFWDQLSKNNGAIINLASFASKRSTLFGNNAAYVASKHGIAGLTKAAAYEGATNGVRVNAIAPGVVETEMIKTVHDEPTRKRIKAFIPQDRFAEPNEIADLVLFLASSRSQHICGEVVNINGGLCMD